MIKIYTTHDFENRTVMDLKSITNDYPHLKKKDIEEKLRTFFNTRCRVGGGMVFLEGANRPLEHIQLALEQ